jgi:hypothetical protein
MYLTQASGGVTSYPPAGQQSLSVRSAILGDVIAPGSTRVYHGYYRDAQLGFCSGGANLTNALAIAWAY